jgi:hypothetical protein
MRNGGSLEHDYDGKKTTPMAARTTCNPLHATPLPKLSTLPLADLNLAVLKALRGDRYVPYQREMEAHSSRTKLEENYPICRLDGLSFSLRATATEALYYPLADLNLAVITT